MVIEPDSSIPRKANITSVNPHGNSLTSYHSEEKAILKMVKEVYWGYCGIDCVENAIHLASVPDVHTYIKEQKLPSRSPSEIAQLRPNHYEIIQEVIEAIEETLIL